jgi:hypothetical protein
MASGDEVFVWSRNRGFKSPLSQLAMYLYIWSRKDAHLADWIVHQRSRAIGNRSQIYSDFARLLAERYKIIVTEDEGLKRRSKTVPGSDDEQTSGFRAHQSIVSPGSLMQAIEQRVGKDRIVRVEAPWNSVTCDSLLKDGEICGHINIGFDGAKSHILNCEIDPINHEHDIDALNCRNQLRRYRERLGDDNLSDTARDSDNALVSGQKGERISK